MRAVLVTGGAGFIGSHLAERLLDAGLRVVVLDNFDPVYDPSAKERNLRRASEHRGFELIRGDIRDGDAAEAAFAAAQPDAVVHLAARAGVRGSIEEPALYASVNLEGTTRVLESARRHGVKRVIFGSSSSVYGNASKIPFSEDDPVDRPISPYAATKRGGELICHAYHHLYGMQIACLRFFTVYGPRQRPDLAIRKFAEILASGGTIDLYGDGSSARDYTFVSDIVDGVVRALDRCRDWHVWNLGGSNPVRLADMVARLAEGLGVEPRVRRLPGQPGDVERTWADTRRSSADLGWVPKVGFDEGLERFLEWFRAERSERVN